MMHVTEPKPPLRAVAGGAVNADGRPVACGTPQPAGAAVPKGRCSGTASGGSSRQGAQLEAAVDTAGGDGMYCLSDSESWSSDGGTDCDLPGVTSQV